MNDGNLIPKHLIPKPDNPLSPFHVYARSVRPHRLDGDRLSFAKGEWLAGEHKLVVPLGTQLVAILSQLRIGWLKFVGGQCVGQTMGLVAESFQPPRREELDDLDGADWETQPDGSTKDPWSNANELPMISPDGAVIYTYTTGSKGGFAALGELCAGFYEELGLYPVVELGSDAYWHKNKSLGRIHVPLLTPVKDGAVPAERYDAILAASRSGGGPSTAAAPKPIESALGNNDNGDGYPDGYGGGPSDDDIPF
jgi:hypothetical protein